MESLINFMEQHRFLGELLTFVIAFAESLPLIGTIIPGSITMTAIGILVGSTILPPIPTISWAVAGAFIGDYIGFWLGAHYKNQITKIWPFSRYPSWLEKGQGFFERHGAKSIIIGRFIGPVRSTTPLIAGLMDMRFLRFVAAAFPSAVIWAVLYITPGILLGALSLEVPHGKATQVVFIGFAVILALWTLFWLIQFSFRQIISGINALIDYWWDWLNRHPKPHRFIQWITRRPQPDDHHQLSLIILASLSFLGFLYVLLAVKFQANLTLINGPLFHLLQSIRSEGGSYFFCLFSLLGAKPVILSYAVILTLFFISQRDWRTMRFWLLLLALSVGSMGVCKTLLFNPRPQGFIVEYTTSSFPSGHTLLSFTILTFAAYLLGQRIPHKFRGLVYFPAALLIALVGASRLYLGAHWFTDVLASYLLGTTILLVVIMGFRRHAWPLETARHWFLIVFILGLMIPWITYTIYDIRELYYERTPLWPVYETSIENWWTAPTPLIPTYRLNRLGQPIQPFNIQWAGYADEIEQRLRDNGWQILGDHLTLRNAAQRLASNKPEYHSPIFSELFRDQKPVISMFKQMNQFNDIIEIRLWDSGVRFSNNPNSLYVGTINYHIQLPKTYSLKAFHSALIINNGAIQSLIPNLKGLRYQVVVLPDERILKSAEHLQWNQRLLIIWDL